MSVGYTRKMLRTLRWSAAALFALAAACTTFAAQTDGASDGGGGDAGSDGAMSTATGCTAALADGALVCESFDEDGGWSALWSPIMPAGTLHLEAPAFSPPFALAARCAMGGECRAGGPSLDRPVVVDAGAGAIRLEAQIQIDPVNPEVYSLVSLLALGPDGLAGTPHLRLVVHGSAQGGAKISVDQRTPGNSSAPDTQLITIPTPSSNAFHAVALVVQYAASPPTVALVIDGAQHGPVATSPALPVAQNYWEIRFGVIDTTVTTQPWTVRYDDVVFSAR